jgi:malate permease and related proteins
LNEEFPDRKKKKMENFIYSINVTMPIFLVMVIGYILKQIGMLNDNFVTVANKFNFKVTLPFMLFKDIAGVDIKAVFDIKYVLFCAIVSTICFWVVWGTAKLLVRDKTIRGAFVQSSFRGSAAVMGLAFIQNIYGSSAMGPLMIVSAVPLYNIFSVIVLTFEANDSTGIDKKAKIRQAGINICKNPIILSILAGLIVGLLEIQFPTLVNKTVSNVAQMATPLALITIGAGFEGRKALAKIAPTMAASMIKLVLQPLVFLPVAAWMGFSGEKMIAILIMLASPTTPSCYIMAKSMNNDEVLTASVIVTTTLMAAFTLTGWIFLLKTLGYIG